MEGERKPKKKIRNEAQWKKNQPKQVSTAASSVSEKSHCNVECLLTRRSKSSCIERIGGVEWAEELREDYHRISQHITGSHKILAERQHLKNLVMNTTPKPGGKRQGRRYFLRPSDGDCAVEVYQKTFCLVFAISEKKIRRIFEIPKINKPRKSAKIQQQRILIEKHIYDYPKEISHYTRRLSARLYLAPDQTVAKMFRNFVTKNPNSGVKYSFYLRVFNTQFNLSFHYPKTDICRVCASSSIEKQRLNLITGSDQDLRTLQFQWQLHKMRAEKWRSRQADAKSKGSHVAAFCFD